MSSKTKEKEDNDGRRHREKGARQGRTERVEMSTNREICRRSPSCLFLALLLVNHISRSFSTPSKNCTLSALSSFVDAIVSRLALRCDEHHDSNAYTFIQIVGYPLYFIQFYLLRRGVFIGLF